MERRKLSAIDFRASLEKDIYAIDVIKLTSISTSTTASRGSTSNFEIEIDIEVEVEIFSQKNLNSMTFHVRTSLCCGKLKIKINKMFMLYYIL